MDQAPRNVQIVKCTSNNSRCRSCGANLSELGSFQYSGIEYNAPKYRLERNSCKKCGKEFLLRYDFFDPENHIDEMVFNGDVNDEMYRWQSILTKEQVGIIDKHLAGCPICSRRHDESILFDAFLGSIIRGQSAQMNGMRHG
jgi:hypothetical protein